MKVFISWSGYLSHKIALILSDWLPKVIQNIDTFVSSEDTDKGSTWNTVITNELRNSSFGILCITRDNINAPWLIFEAGALSNAINKALVCPFLFNIKTTEIKGPIKQFQSTIFEKKDFERLVITINKNNPKNTLSEIIIKESFNLWYPKLKKELNAIQINQDIKPLLYIPLKDSFIHLIGAKHTYAYPYMKHHNEHVESIEFRDNGFYFPGTAMVGVYNPEIPCGREPRSFIFAFMPTVFPDRNQPMFIFSYGKRCHDKAFGLFWGVPHVNGKEGFKTNNRIISLKVFTYCGIKKTERTSNICDIDIPYVLELSPRWVIGCLTYDGRLLRVHINSKEVLCTELILNTYNTKYLNIGGFIHHTESGNLNPKNMDYSMKGYIREFMMFNKCLSTEEIHSLTSSIKNKLEEQKASHE